MAVRASGYQMSACNTLSSSQLQPSLCVEPHSGWAAKETLLCAAHTVRSCRSGCCQQLAGLLPSLPNQPFETCYSEFLLTCHSDTVSLKSKQRTCMGQMRCRGRIHDFRIL